MSPTPLPIAEDDLHGFIDGEIDDDRREAVLAYLTNTPADAARVETWRQQNILLKAAFSQVAIEQVPANLSFAFAPRLISLSSPPIEGATRDTYPRRRQRRSLALAVAAFAAGVGVTLVADLSVNRYRAFAIETSSEAPSQHGPALALLATSTLHHTHQAQAPGHHSAADPGAIEPALVILPGLKRQGLELLRGEVGGNADEPANCLDFADASGTPVVLCVAPAKPSDGPKFQGLGVVSANAIYWREGRSLYALAAPLRSERLIVLARQIHALLATPRTP